MSGSIFALLADAPSAVETRNPDQPGTPDGESSFEGILNGMQQYGGDAVPFGGGTLPVALHPDARALPVDVQHLVDWILPQGLADADQPESIAAAEMQATPEMKLGVGDSLPDPEVTTPFGIPKGPLPVGQLPWQTEYTHEPAPDDVRVPGNALMTDSDGRPDVSPDLSVVTSASRGVPEHIVPGDHEAPMAPVASDLLSGVAVEKASLPVEHVHREHVTPDAGAESGSVELPPAPEGEPAAPVAPVVTGQDAERPAPDAVSAEDADGKEEDTAVPFAQTRTDRPTVPRETEVTVRRGAVLNSPGVLPTGEQTLEASSTLPVEATANAGTPVRPSAAAVESLTAERQTPEQLPEADQSDGKGVMTWASASDTVERTETPGVDGRGVLPRVDTADFVDRVVRFVRTMIGREQSSVEMRLHPPELGNVRLSMSVNDGELRMALETSTEAARQIVADNVEHLRGTLVQQGYDVTRVDVSLGHDFAETQTSHSDAEPEHFTGSSADTPSDTDAPGPGERPRSWVHTSRYLDVVA